LLNKPLDNFSGLSFSILSGSGDDVIGCSGIIGSNPLGDIYAA